MGKKLSKRRALKTMLESLALILSAVDSQLGGPEQGGAECKQGFLEESTQGGNCGKGWDSRATFHSLRVPFNSHY